MSDKLSAAREEVGTDIVARLMPASGASRSNDRTWLRNGGATVKLGRPTFFSPEEEDIIAAYMVSWTKDGDILTFDLAAVLLRQSSGDVGRVEETERMFVEGGVPYRILFHQFLGRHPQLHRVRPAALEGVRAEAATPEAVAKFFAAFRLVCREFGITRAAQVWNTDESMMNAEELMEGAGSAVVTDDPSATAEYVIPSVQNGSEAASLEATVCADGSRLPLFVVVSGSGGRFPFAEIAQEDGFTRRTPLAGYLDEGAEVHRREKPGFDGPLWEVFAGFAARHLGKRCLDEWKVLLMDGCRVHASPVGVHVLKASKVVILMFPSHLSHILQALDHEPFLKTKSNARSGMRALLPTIPRGTKFNLVHHMRVIRRAAFTGLSSVNVLKGFENTGTWPMYPSVIKADRLVKGKGPVNAARKVDLEQLAFRLGPEARSDMREQVVSFGSISNRGRAIEATNDAMLKATDDLAAVSASKQAAKDKHQAAKISRAADSICQAAHAKVATAQRRCSPAVVARKESLRRRAARARAAAGPVASYVCARGAVVQVEPRPKRQQQAACVMGMGGQG